MNGYFEAWVNSIAWNYSAREREDVSTISTIVQTMFGGQVYLAGSQKKKTAIIGSDLDLCINTNESINTSDRKQLAKAIRKEIQRETQTRNHVIRIHPASDIVRIDIAFANATFGNRPLPNDEDFKVPRRKHAARALKAWVSSQELPRVGGWAIEALVVKLDHNVTSGAELFIKVLEWLEEDREATDLESILKPFANPWYPEWSPKLPGRLTAVRNAARHKLRQKPDSFSSPDEVELWIMS